MSVAGETRSIAAPPRGGRGAVFGFALSIFLGAFLLFLVEPLLGKFILPWFGGSAAVWTVCLLFFQTLLLLGYAYAHFSTSLLRPRGQAILHVALLAIAVCMLPIAPGTKWEPSTGADDVAPAVYILLLLAACVGLPYLVLSATGPLLQAWFAGALKRPPYRLYALSNAGSLLALVCYPLAVEPYLSRTAQANAWSIGMGVFAVLCAGCAAFVFWRPFPPSANSAKSVESSPIKEKSHWLLWLVLPLIASMLLLATTNKLCQEVAVVPFLWVAPLAVYLLSFVITFDHPRWYRRIIFGPLLAIALAGVGVMLYEVAALSGQVPVLLQIGLYLLALFAGCMVCHGELFRLRPAAGRLTAFYLCIAAGGALGGAFVAGLAPVIFTGYFELNLSLFACAVLAAAIVYFDRASPMGRGKMRLAWYAIFIGLVLLGCVLWVQDTNGVWQATPIARWRDFYGTLSVWDRNAADPAIRQSVLQHGGIEHGLQFTDPAKRDEPTTYYGRDSGVGRAIRALQMRNHSPLHPKVSIGVVGLGTGTLASYGRPQDRIVYYELDPAVERIARQYFTFLADAKCATPPRVMLGDARLTLQRQPPQQLDLLVLDAFNGDTIPVHLLTRQAFELYLHHLEPDGIIAVHISNQHIELEPVLAELAANFHLQTDVITTNYGNGDERAARSLEAQTGQVSSKWVLLTRAGGNFSLPPIAEAGLRAAQNPEHVPLWTDERTSVLPLLR